MFHCFKTNLIFVTTKKTFLFLFFDKQKKNDFQLLISHSCIDPSNFIHWIRFYVTNIAFTYMHVLCDEMWYIYILCVINFIMLLIFDTFILHCTLSRTYTSDLTWHQHMWLYPTQFVSSIALLISYFITSMKIVLLFQNWLVPQSSHLLKLWFQSIILLENCDF
jgi:hypothetical protein